MFGVWRGCREERLHHGEKTTSSDTVQKHEAGGSQGLEIIGLTTESSNPLASFPR